jgi:hypothetical protein
MKWNLMMVLGMLSFARQLENVAVENQKNMIREMESDEGVELFL